MLLNRSCVAKGAGKHTSPMAVTITRPPMPGQIVAPMYHTAPGLTRKNFLNTKRWRRIGDEHANPKRPRQAKAWQSVVCIARGSARMPPVVADPTDPDDDDFHDRRKPPEEECAPGR